MHTAEVFRALQNARQFANRNGGSVRRQNGIRTNFIFCFCQHRFFDFRVFNNGFDNHIDTIKTAVFQCWMDSRNDAREFQSINFSALQLFIQQLRGFGHAQRQGFVVDVLHDHRHAFPGGLISDPAAHDACAQNGGLLWHLNVFCQLFCFAFHELIVQENTNQRAGFIGVRQRDETLVFEFERLFTTKARSGFNGFYSGNRRRVVLARRLHHHAFGNGKAHGGFNFAELQRLKLRLTFGFPVEIAIDRLT
ncbi:hypothetical protein D3C80_1091040 [compost metagenome]